MIVVAGRLYASLGLETGVLPVGDAAWRETALDVGFMPPHATVTNVLTRESFAVRDGRVAMANAFRRFPAALLHYAAGG